MLFNRKRVEEDLEKIRKANLPSKDSNFESNTNSSYVFDRNAGDEDLKLEKGDLLAMILAVMSLIVPYILAFVGIMAVVVFLLGYFY